MAKTVIGPDGRQYATVSCAHCGVIIPRYDAIEWSEQVEAGQSSDAHRSGWSTRSGFSRRGFWFGSGRSGSVSSGRTYWRTKTVFLCPQCYANVPKPELAPPESRSIGRASLRGLLDGLLGRR
jgi:hypothetical protein